MSTEQLKALLIEKIIYSQDDKLLQDAFDLLSAATQSPLKLNPDQKAMIERGFADIESGRVISQEELQRRESEWLRGSNERSRF